MSDDETDRPADELVVSDEHAESRYEARLAGVLAGIAAYTLSDGRIVFTHTEVDDAFEGRGVAGRLVRWALDDVRRRGLVVVPRCPFVRSFIEKHPEYADLLAPGGR